MVNFLLRIPNYLKNRITRSSDFNDNQKTQHIYGTIKYTGLNKHDYNIPNSHYRGVFDNICPEDLSIYWNFPYRTSTQRAYFKEINYNSFLDSSVKKTTLNEVVEETLKEEGYFYSGLISKYIGLNGVLFGFGAIAC